MDIVDFVLVRPKIRGRSKNWLDKIDSRETEEVDEGSDEGENGDDLKQVMDMKRGGITNVLAPVSEQEVDHKEKQSEEDNIDGIIIAVPKAKM